MVTTAIVGACLGLFGQAVWSAREAARQTQCHGQMFHLNFALVSYHDTYGRFPPAYVPGPDGTPWHSWRVLVLPFLDQHRVYEQYKFDEPWDGPNNRLLADKINLNLFQCPSGGDRGGRTQFVNYCIVVGPNTAFPAARLDPGPNAKAPSQAASKPIDPNKIVLVEIVGSDIHWMEPRDLHIKSLLTKRNKFRVGSPHPQGAGIVRFNGAFEQLPVNISLRELSRKLQQ